MKLLPFLLYSVIILPIAKSANEKTTLDKPDKSKWVDPSDMINFDHGANRMRSDEKIEPKKMQIYDEQTDKLRTDLSECRRNLLEQASNFERSCSSSMETFSSAHSSAEVVIFKHLLSKISQKFEIDLRKKFDNELYFDVKINLDKIQIEKWSKFVHSSSNNVDLNLLQDIMESFPDLFSRVKRRSDSSQTFREPNWSEKLQKYLPILNIVLLVPIVCFYYIRFINLSRSRLCFLFFISAFFASTVWTWMHLYLIKRAENISRMYQAMPEACRPKNSEPILNVFKRYFKSLVFFSEPNECLQYQKDTLVDPFWEVSPMQAISVTFAKFFFEPLEIIAHHFNRFLTAYLKDLPLTVYWIAIPFLLIMIVLLFVFILFLLFSVVGCRMSFVYGLISIEPYGRHQNAIAPAAPVPTNQPQLLPRPPPADHPPIARDVDAN